jgi:hypothetical protein
MSTVELPAPAGQPAPEFPVGAGVLDFDVAYPEHLSRALIFVKWLLVIPHLVVLYFLGIAVAVVTFIAWFAILVTGNYPRGMWEFALMVHRWQVRVNAYTCLMRDEYPPFGNDPYPVRFEIAYPTQMSRWLIFVKWLLVIPHAFCLAVLGFAAAFVLLFAFFAILFTGRYPQGAFEFLVGLLRWNSRVTLYSGLMTDVYPPFSLE